MQTTTEMAGVKPENTNFSDKNRVFKYENLIKSFREEFWPDFMSRDAEISEKKPVKSLKDWKIYPDSDRKTRAELVNRAKANSKSIEFMAWLLENQNLCFEDNSSHLIKHLNRKWIYIDLSDWKYSLEKVWFDLLVKNLEYSKKLSDFAILNWKSKIEKQFIKLFNWDFVSACVDYEVRMLEKLSYRAIIELLERNYPDEMAEIKLQVCELEWVKSDIQHITLWNIADLDENISLLKDSLEVATSEEASELKKKIKDLQTRRSNLLKWAIKKLEDKKKAIQKRLLKTKKTVLPVMFPIFCKAYY